MATITMMTDFGIKDGNVGVMKGVIWGISPSTQIVDLSHLISPQNVREAALVLARSAPYFPDGTIHLVVVDPGVGTARNPLAAHIGNCFFVGPDNGVITLLLKRAQTEDLACEFVVLDQSRYWLPEVSFVFHGRDIFAPVAAHLANGVPLSSMGTPITKPISLDLPEPHIDEGVWRGEVIHIDHFGNIASNIRVEHIGTAIRDKNSIVVRLGGIQISGLVNTFGERSPGSVISLLGSTGNLIVAVVNGDAASALEIKVGDAIEVQIPQQIQASRT